MLTAPSGAGQRQRIAAEFFCNSDLARRLLDDIEVKRRISTVRKTVGYGQLTNDDLNGLAKSAIALGFYRALVNRFSEEHDITTEWWIEKRRLHARNGKDRTEDLSIITVYYPEFVSYYPAVALTEIEVFAAAKIEFRDSIASPGSDYHQRETESRHWRQGISSDTPVQPVHTLLRTDRRDIASWAPDFWAPDFLDPEAHSRVENIFARRIDEDDSNIFGPIVTRAVQLALREYGPSAMHWLNDLIFFPKKYTDNLRSIGQTEEMLGKAEFERVKRDMIRKLPEMHAHMLEVMRNDPEIQRLRALLSDEVQSPTVQKSKPAPSAIAHERSQYQQRMCQKISHALSKEGLPELTADELVELIPDFLAFQRNPFKHSHFVRQVQRLIKERV